MDISFGEKLTDVSRKLNTARAVLTGMLPGGRFQMETITRTGPHGRYDVKCFKNVPTSVGPHVRELMRTHKEKDWLVYGGTRITFGYAEQLLDHVGAELSASFGVKQGTVVAIAMRNLPEYALAFFAVTAMGAVAVPLNALWGTQELEYAVKDSGSEVIIGDLQRLRLCRPFLSGTDIRCILCQGTPAEAQEVGAAMWDDVVAAGKGKPYPSIEGVKPDDNVMIMYTSGSTGFPKGVIHSQRAFNNYLRMGIVTTYLVPDPQPACLMAVPLFHITALAGILTMSLARADKLVFMYKWDAAEALNLIEKEKITRFTGVPTMIGDMYAHPNFTPEKVKTLKIALAGGAPVPPKQVESMRKKAKHIGSQQAYGLTETFGLATVNSGTDYLKNPGSCGRALPLLIDLCVKDPEGNKLPEGKRGEVCIKSVFNMKGYQNKDKATAEVFDGEGYFHTGDVGEIHGGFLYIKDRLKDIIIRGGENIDCSEVEAAFYTYPGEVVREVSVFGLPDERLGENVGACIFMEGEHPSVQELVAHASMSLAKFKVPEANRIWIRNDALPKGATGKIDKKGLREFYRSQATPQSKL